jgi:hypothetical protein
MAHVALATEAFQYQKWFRLKPTPHQKNQLESNPAWLFSAKE